MLGVDPNQLAVFLLAAAVLALTPGPGVAYVVARTVEGGPRQGLVSALGTAAGGAVHVATAALGLSLLVTQSAVAFGLVRYAGACYLVYLGIRILLSGATFAPPLDLYDIRRVPRAAARSGRAFVEGILVETLNVKTALFFLAFIPQFIDPHNPPIAQFVLLGAICVALNTGIDILAVCSSARLMRGAAGRVLGMGAVRLLPGTVMIGLGAWVAISEIPQ